MDGDEKFTVPLPAPRKSSSSKIDKKSTISPPFNFRHVSHVGMDFKSEDVRRAIRPMSKLEELDSLPVAPTLASPSDGYEKVSPRSSQQSADLDSPASSPVHYENIPRTKVLLVPSPVDSNRESSPRSSQQSADLSQRLKESLPSKNLSLDDVIPKVDVSWYQNVSSVRSANELSIHTYENIEAETASEMNARISKKKKPAPPPPPRQSPRNSEDDNIQNHEHNVMWRPQAPTSPLKPLSEHQIKTPEKIEQQCALSLVLERPDVLGEMKLRLDDAIPVSSSVHSQSTPAKATSLDCPEVKPRTHWLSDLPAEEQKRISGLWQQATGEIEVPDDSIAVKKAIAMFEARLRNPKPPRPPPPRRHAPPPPISMSAEVNREQKNPIEVDDGKKDKSSEANSEKPITSQDSKDACNVQHVTVQTVPAGGEVQERLPSPFPSSVQQFPIPKPRMKLLEKVNEETAEVTCIQPSAVQLPEYSVEECTLNLSLIGLNTTSEASCEENRSCVSVEKSDGTFVACEMATENDRRNHDASLVEVAHVEDSEDKFVITRF